MRLSLRRFGVALSLAAIAGGLALPTTARAAEELWALTTSNNLINFNSAVPGAFSLRPITGLAPGEVALGIDFRPALPTGRLYVLGSTNRLYLVSDPYSGVATPVGGGPFAPALTGLEYGFDFNPTVDRIRLVGDSDQNLRAHPDLGTIVATDSLLYYVGGDPNAGMNPNVTAAAYTNSVAGAVTTLLYDIDSNLDVLAVQAPPNVGRLTTVGSLGIDVTDDNGFDISGATGVAFLVSGWGATNAALYTLDLASGSSSLVGAIGCNERVRGLSVGRELPTPAAPTSWGRLKDSYR